VFFGRVQVAAEIAAPLAQTKAVKMVSIGKGDVGAAKLTGEVLDVMERLPKTVEGLTGVDISKVSCQCIVVQFYRPVGGMCVCVCVENIF